FRFRAASCRCSRRSSCFPTTSNGEKQRGALPCRLMPDIGAIEPTALKARLDRADRVFILDVREPAEIAVAPFPGARRIPMGDIPSRLTELDPDRETV